MYRNSGYYFAAGLALAGLAFWRSYVSRVGTDDIAAYTHLHAVVMTTWFALLIVQPFLLRADRRAAHRALGQAVYVVAPLVVATSLLLVHRGLVATEPRHLGFGGTMAYLPISMAVAYAIAVGLAMGYRKTPALHARFMICSALAFVDPVLSRIAIFYLPRLPSPFYYPIASLAVTAVVLAILVARDRHRQGRAAFAAMAGVFAVVYLGWFVLAPTAGWGAFVGWFRALPLT